MVQASQFMPHGMCFEWQPAMLVAQVTADALIAAAYVFIAAALVWIVRKRGDLPFMPVFVMFALFILSCAATHVMSIAVIWSPLYWPEAAVKWVTAIASVSTALLLVPVAPKVLAIRSPREFEMLNAKLQQSVADRDAELKLRLAERTRERDDDAREKARAELQRTDAAERQLRLHARELENVVAELESFSYTVSHDLRAPVRALIGYAHLLLDEYAARFDAEGRRLLEVIASEASRMGELIDGLLSFSGLGRQPLARTSVDMAALAAEVATEFTRTGEPLPEAFEIAALPAAFGDRLLLRQVWQNLISNAVKYSAHAPRRTIAIWAEAGPNGCAYHVRDNGVGFEMAHAAKLFGVFQRLHRSDEFAGTGVGLAIVKRIVERHGGAVRAAAKLGEGATFTFSLPLQRAD